MDLKAMMKLAATWSRTTSHSWRQFDQNGRCFSRVSPSSFCNFFWRYRDAQLSNNFCSATDFFAQLNLKWMSTVTDTDSLIPIWISQRDWVYQEGHRAWKLRHAVATRSNSHCRLCCALCLACDHPSRCTACNVSLCTAHSCLALVSGQCVVNWQLQPTVKKNIVNSSRLPAPLGPLCQKSKLFKKSEVGCGKLFFTPASPVKGPVVWQ